MQISGPPRPNLGRRLGRVGLGAHLPCGAPGPVPLRFWLGGGGAGRFFSSGSGGVPVGPPIHCFFAFLRTPPTERFCFVVQINPSVRDKSRTKSKLAGGAASGPDGSGFDLSRSFLAWLGLGGGGLVCCWAHVSLLWWLCGFGASCVPRVRFRSVLGGPWVACGPGWLCQMLLGSMRALCIRSTKPLQFQEAMPFVRVGGLRSFDNL